MTERALDETRADDRVDVALARAEVAAWQVHRLEAERMAAVVAVIREARHSPQVYVIPRDEPTPRDIAFAVEAAVADIAVRLSLSEATVTALVRRGELLLDRAPSVWAVFREGEISAHNAACVADVLESLPVDPSAPTRGSRRAPLSSRNSCRLASVSGFVRSGIACTPNPSVSATSEPAPLVVRGSITTSMAWRGSACT